jgi:hypothetical protein
VKLSELRSNISVIPLNNRLKNLGGFPAKHQYFIKDGGKTESAPPAPSSSQTRFTTDAGDALAQKDPRKAKFFGLDPLGGTNVSS